MNNSFPRMIALLRKERGISQKMAAGDLGISQALLSHYEKGIRECGLDFLVRAADYYGVSCDYLLGRTPDRNGAFLTVEDIPDPEQVGKENVFRGSILPTLNKKLIANSLNILYDKLQRCNNKGLTTEISHFLMLAVYRVLHILYTANPRNPAGLFGKPPKLARPSAAAAMMIAEANAEILAGGGDIDTYEGLDDQETLSMTPEKLSQEYPLFAGSLLNLVQAAETRMDGNGQKNGK